MVILGPVADIAMQKLMAEMPDRFEIAGEKPGPIATLLVNHFPSPTQARGLRQLARVLLMMLFWGKEV